jgi:hypothetical protein
MTGSQSISFAQLHAIMDEVNKHEIAARHSMHYANTDQGRVYTGQPVTIVIHQAERIDKPLADKHVEIHRAFTDTVHLWLDRNGREIT